MLLEVTYFHSDTAVSHISKPLELAFRNYSCDGVSFENALGLVQREHSGEWEESIETCGWYKP